MRPAITSAMLVVLVSCGGANVQKQAAEHLTTALAATNAARDAFTTYDRAHQAAIVEAAETPKKASEAIHAYRTKRATVVRAFTVAYSAISAAGVALAAIEHQKEGASIDVAQLLIDATKAVLDVKRAIDALKGIHADPQPSQ